MTYMREPLCVLEAILASSELASFVVQRTVSLAQVGGAGGYYRLQLRLPLAGRAQAPPQELSDYRQNTCEREQTSPPGLARPRFHLELGRGNSRGDWTVANLAADFQAMSARSESGDGDVPRHGVGPGRLIQPVGEPHQLLGLVVQGRKLRPDQ